LLNGGAVKAYLHGFFLQFLGLSNQDKFVSVAHAFRDGVQEIGVAQVYACALSGHGQAPCGL
jgi:hypothetical protein